MRHPSLMDGAFMPGGGEGALLSSNNLMAVETNSAFPSLIGFGDSSGAADMQRLSLLTPAMPGDVAVAGAGRRGRARQHGAAPEPGHPARGAAAAGGRPPERHPDLAAPLPQRRVLAGDGPRSGPPTRA